jgi:chaperonin cofactor prefoldin
MLETESEKLANEKVKIEMGISDKVIALAEIDGVSEEEAIKRLEDIDKRKLESMQKLIDQMPQDQAQPIEEGDTNGDPETQAQSI